MHVNDIIQVIEKIAPPQIAASWDNSGIQCFSEQNNISKVAVCLDALPELIESAIIQERQFILSHHPISLKPEFPNKFNNYYRSISLLLNHKIWLYAAHTSLDANPEGPVNFLAKQLKLRDLEILDTSCSNMAGYGFGCVGNLSSPCLYKNFINIVGKILDLKTIILCGNKSFDQYITRIGYCPGSGADLIKEAEQKNCDVFLTGDIKYHSALDANIAVMDVGHHAMEEKMMYYLYHDLMKLLPGLDFIFMPSQSPLQTIILNSEKGNE